jgi:hypothetical protein
MLSTLQRLGMTEEELKNQLSTLTSKEFEARFKMAPSTVSALRRRHKILSPSNKGRRPVYDKPTANGPANGHVETPTVRRSIEIAAAPKPKAPAKKGKPAPKAAPKKSAPGKKKATAASLDRYIVLPVTEAEETAIRQIAARRGTNPETLCRTSVLTQFNWELTQATSA